MFGCMIDAGVISHSIAPAFPFVSAPPGSECLPACVLIKTNSRAATVVVGR